jgi:hypothetical protein
MYKLIIAGVGVLAVVLLAIGCGGGSDEATAQVSRAEFYKQARNICAKTQAKLQAEFQESGKSIAAVYKNAAPLLKEEAEELESIAGPDQVEETTKSMIANLMKISQVVAREGNNAADDPRIARYKKEAFELHLNEC